MKLLISESTVVWYALLQYLCLKQVNILHFAFVLSWWKTSTLCEHCILWLLIWTLVVAANQVPLNFMFDSWTFPESFHFISLSPCSQGADSRFVNGIAREHQMVINWEGRIGLTGLADLSLSGIAMVHCGAMGMKEGFKTIVAVSVFAIVCIWKV